MWMLSDELYIQLYKSLKISKELTCDKHGFFKNSADIWSVNLLILELRKEDEKWTL